MKIIESLSGVVLTIFILWLLFSWADVLCHNNPVDGDYKYSPVNMFTLIGDLYE